MATSDNKRIAFNSVVLYVKLTISIVVGFVTARLVLDVLGASDYGLYNVVGGIVSLLNILGTSMVATSYRYMAVELGKGENGDPNKVYNTIFVVHLFLAIILLIVGETIGAFYVNHYLNVDSAKIPDALFVLHLSLLTTAFAVITIPLNGLIIAKEKFLFTSIVETASALTKLAMIIALMHMDGNKLRIYASFLAIIQLSIPLCYQVYCRIKDKDIVKWNVNKNVNDYKDMFGFAGWILLGAVACVGKTQGAAMIINFFFGTILNSAFGLASQVNNAVSQFTGSLSQAAVPQIMKNQKGNEQRSLQLVYAISRYSYLSMCMLAIPLLFCIDDVLFLWLGDNVPEYTSSFVIFMLINGMVSNLGAGFDATIQATGKIRKNQIGYSLIGLSLLPIIFVLYKLGFPPYINVIVMVFLTFLTLVFQFYILKELTSFEISEYLKQTISPCLSSTMTICLVLSLMKLIIPHDSVLSSLLFLVFCVLLTVTTIYYLGLNCREKSLVVDWVSSIFIKKVHYQ